MDTVKENQQLTIGKCQCRIVKSNNWWCSNDNSGTNEYIFTQFGLTKKDIWSVLGYESHGGFPQCKTAEDLTKVIEFILSKDSVKKPDLENYTGKTIRALVNNPQCTGVQIGEEIKILKVYNTSSYVLDKNVKGSSGMWINRPLNLKEWVLVGESSTKVDMKAIQEECKRRFPIGCRYKDPDDNVSHSGRILKQDYSTYSIQSDNVIYAHSGGGCLYKDGVYAALVSLPEKTPSIPEYVEAINKSDGYTIGTIYKTLYSSTKTNYRSVDDKGRENGWGAGNFKPSTKEAYDAQFISTTFVLPERWCLKITSDTEKVLNDWRKRQPGFKELSVGFKGWLVSDKRDGTYTHWDTNVPDRYKEITYGQFLSYVHNPILYDGCSKGIESLIEKEIDSIYQVGYDDYYKPKTKPLIEDVQSVSVKLSTKRKINNKFKI